jgi:hypothetical protein
MRGLLGRRAFLNFKLKIFGVKSFDCGFVSAEPEKAKTLTSAGNGQAAVGRAHRGAVHIFAQVHQCQESTENTGFKVVCEGQPAGGDAGERLAIFGDEAHDFTLALMRRVAEGGFAAHGGAAGFERQSEMQNADAMLGESRGRIVLATCGLATSSHLGRESRSK